MWMFVIHDIFVQEGAQVYAHRVRQVHTSFECGDCGLSCFDLMALISQPCVSTDSQNKSTERIPLQENEEVKLLRRMQELHNELEYLEEKLSMQPEQGQNPEQVAEAAASKNELAAGGLAEHVDAFYYSSCSGAPADISETLPFDPALALVRTQPEESQDWIHFDFDCGLGWRRKTWRRSCECQLRSWARSAKRRDHLHL